MSLVSHSEPAGKMGYLLCGGGGGSPNVCFLVAAGFYPTSLSSWYRRFTTTPSSFGATTDYANLNLHVIKSQMMSRWSLDMSTALQVSETLV